MSPRRSLSAEDCDEKTRKSLQSSAERLQRGRSEEVLNKFLSMKIIQFKENQREMWNKFIAENSSESFLQAWEWGSFNRVLGRKVWRIGIIDNDLLNKNKLENTKYSLLAAALLIKYDLPFEQSYLYCPRGPVVSQNSIKSKVVDFLFSEIKKIAKEEKAMFLKIDPPISCWFHSGGSPVEPKCKSCAKGSTALLGLWSQHCNFKKSSNEIQPKNTLILDLNKSEEELLKEMKPKTRYNIRLAERRGVKIGSWKTLPSISLSGGQQQEYFKKKFERFWKLTEETSKRDKFASHNKNYYWKMLESLNGVHASKNPPSPLFQRGNPQEGNILYCLQAKLYLAEYKNKTIVANIVLSFGDFCVYLHGASSNEHRNVMAPYLLQWQQILDAKKTGCKSYDFWGIENSQKFIKSKVHKVKSDWSGITRFKKGFGGQERNYTGAYDLVFNREKYYLYKVFRKVRNFHKR